MGRRARGLPSRRTHPQPQRRGRNARQLRKGKGEYTGEDFNDLVQQLTPLGLTVRRMEADGNCLFRAFADQLIGDSAEHMQFREECCEYMLANAEELSLFHAEEDTEEAEPFEAYVERMRGPGLWGSQLELLALCRRHEVNAIVHQSGLPAYEMVVAPLAARCVQLSYHDGEHYNSIRFASDVELGKPAQCLSLQQVRGLRPEGEDVGGQADGNKSTAGAPIAAAEGPEPSSSAASPGKAGPGVEEAAVAAEDAEASAPAGAAKATKPAKASRPEKRTERRRAKEATEQQRKAVAAEESLPEALSLLTKQLITV